MPCLRPRRAVDPRAGCAVALDRALQAVGHAGAAAQVPGTLYHGITGSTARSKMVPPWVLATALSTLLALALPAVGQAPPRVATGNGALTLEFSRGGTAAITALDLGSGLSPSADSAFKDMAMVGPSVTGGYALREFPSGHTCSGHGPPVNSSSATNQSLLVNGNFSQAAASPQAAAGWSPFNLGYARVTGVARPGNMAAIAVRTTGPRQQAGALQIWTTPPGVSFGSLLLSGWSRAESDSGGAATDYSVYADVGYADGSWSFGHVAPFVAGPHDWQYSSAVIELGRPVHALHIYAMYRNRVGVVYFDDISLSGTEVQCTPDSAHSKGSATAIPAESATVSLASVVRPAGWKTDAVTTASFVSHEDHIRVQGSVALSHTEPCPYPDPCPNGSTPADRSVSLQLSFPLPQAVQERGGGWRVWSDAETFTTLPTRNASSSVGGKHLYGGQREGVGALAFAVDRYPMLVLTSPDGGRGIMLAVPMEPTLYIYRISYDTLSRLLSITFDFGLTSRSQRFPSMATFACLLFPLAHPQWGFRGALQQYYERYPAVWLEEQAVIRRQGTWVACVPDIRSLPGWQDFGIVFAEESTGFNASQSMWMNEQGIQIFPYIEPDLIHWRLPKGVAATWPNLSQSLTGCAGNSSCAGQAQAHAIISTGKVKSDGSLLWCPEQEPWSTGAMFFAGLSPATLADPKSWASQKLAGVQAAYDASISGGYQISGQYIDSVLAFNSEFGGNLNYRPSTLATTSHPPVFDNKGTIAVFGAAEELSFLLEVVGKTVRGRGQSVMGNGLFAQGTPAYNYPLAFDVMGTEIDWQASDEASRVEKGKFTPPPAFDLRFARAMAGARPYIYLLDTNFDTWTKDYTDQYFQTCLTYGFWPSFFSADAADHVYFTNSSLIERDRPIWRQFIPVLKVINMAGWEPLALINASNAGGSSGGGQFVVERFGSLQRGTRIFFTLRRLGNATEAAAVALPALILTLHVAQLGLAAKQHAVTEIAQQGRLNVTVLPLVVRLGAETAEVQIAELPYGVTLVLEVH